MNFSDDPRRLSVPLKKPKFKKRPKRIKPKPPNLPAGYNWYKCPTASWALRTKPVDKPRELDVQGFKFDDAPIRWEIAPSDPPVVTGIKLLRNFYREARWWRKPMAWCRNPEKEGIPIFGPDDAIMALYGGSYHITIERNQMFGPHPARLFYHSKNFSKEIAWVAIVQLECMWHSDERMLNALNHEIRNRNFYQSNETAIQTVLQ